MHLFIIVYNTTKVISVQLLHCVMSHFIEAAAKLPQFYTRNFQTDYAVSQLSYFD